MIYFLFLLFPNKTKKHFSFGRDNKPVDWQEEEVGVKKRLHVWQVVA